MEKNISKLKTFNLKIITGSEYNQKKIPMMQFEAPHKGPVIWLTACAHGDEIGGIVIIQELFRMLKKYGLTKGTVFSFPLMNPIGFETGSRNISFSKEDLNRTFPGDPKGTLAERIAYKIFTVITDTKPDLVIDLHNDWINSTPYAVLDNIGEDQEIAKKILLYAEDSSLLIVQEGTEEDRELSRTLTASLLRKSIPALTCEMGSSFTIDEKNVRYGLAAIWNILSRAGMTRPLSGPSAEIVDNPLKGKVLHYDEHPYASSSGIIRFMKKPKDLLKKGEAFAKIYSPFGVLLETLRAEADSIMLGYSDLSVSFPGKSVAAFGIIS